MVNHDLPAVRRHVNEVFWIHQSQLLHDTPDQLLNRNRLDELLGLQLP
jgi:ABC-type Mn2+/Zn2+ transport system ATPase subunit